MDKLGKRQIAAALLVLCVALAGCGEKQDVPQNTPELPSVPATTESEPLPEMPAETGTQPEEYPPLEFYGDDSVESQPDFTSFAGRYDGVESEFDGMELDAQGNFTLYRGTASASSGRIVYVCKPEFYEFYAYDPVDEIYRRVISADENSVEIHGLGKYTRSAEQTLPATDFADFEGAWYLDGDISGDCYLLIDRYGYWSYFDGGELTDVGQLEQTGGLLAVGQDSKTYQISLTSESALQFDGRSFEKDE